MKRVFVSVILLICVRSYAQPVLSLKDALQKVRDNYPSIKMKASLVQSAQYTLNAGKKDYLPELTVAQQFSYATDNGVNGTSFSNNGTVLAVSGGVRPQNIYTPVAGNISSLIINWHAFTFGRIQQQVNYAASRLQYSRNDLDNEIFQQQIKAVDAYLLLELAQKLVQVRQDNLQRALAFQEYVLARSGAGLLPGADSSHANAEVASAQLALLQGEQEVAYQKIQLSQLTAVNADSLLIDTMQYLQSIPVALKNDSLSVVNNPAIQLAKADVDAQTQRSLMIKKSVLPNVDVIGAGMARGSGISNTTGDYKSAISDGLPYQAYNYLVGVGLNWNILSLVKNKQQYQAAKQDIHASEYKLEENELIIQRQLKNAALQYKLSLQQAKVAPVQYSSALEAYNQSNARYQAGLATLPEQQEALYTLTRSDVDKAVANNNAWRSLLQIAAATGDLQIFLQQ